MLHILKDLLDAFWHDPVWSKIIASILYALGAALVTKYVLPKRLRIISILIFVALFAVAVGLYVWFSFSNGIPLGRALFLDVSQGQDQWHGLTAWAEVSGLQITLLRKPFESWSFSGEGPGVIIFPLPYRRTLDDKKA